MKVLDQDIYIYIYDYIILYTIYMTIQPYYMTIITDNFENFGKLSSSKYSKYDL